MMPSERVDSIESYVEGKVDGVGISNTISCISHSSGTENDTSVVGCLGTTGSCNSGSVNGKGQDLDACVAKGPATHQECSKLVQGLNRDTAVYCALSMSVGGTCDSYILRDELAQHGNKVFDTAILCKRRLMPLLLSKRLKDEEREDLERLYRIFAGCLEMLQAEFIRSITMQALFPLWDSSTKLIQTGISEAFTHRKLCTNIESLDATDLERKARAKEEVANVERKVSTLGEMLYSTSQLMDIQPWDYKPDTDHTKIEVDTSDIECEGSETIEEEAHINTGSPRHRKCIWIMVLTLGIVIVVAGVLGLAFALDKGDNSTR